jgi:Flp pilus assembly protein TadB
MSWVAGVLIVVTVLLGLPRPSRLPTATARPSPPPDRGALHRSRPLLATAAGAGGWAVLGGPWGWLVGAAAAVTVWVVLGRTEPPASRRRREQLLADVPTGVDLLAVCLEAGAAPESALLTAGRAIGGPLGEEFLALHHRLLVGLSPAEVWRSAAEHPQLAPLGRAVGRAHQSGAAVSGAVHQAAVELRERSLAQVEERARGIEVRAAAPLGLCLLPAFLLLGVVPMVAAVFGSMRLF